jgi:hypothetical protein
VEQCSLLRDFVDCIVALFAQARGHCDHAIEICTQVLQRTPCYVAALVARGVAYKFHASGHFDKQANADYAALLKQDASLQPLLAERFTLENYKQVDVLVLRLHPWLLSEQPKPYEEYEVYPKRQPALVVFLVCFAVAKFRTLVRSARLVRSVRRKYEELVLQRAAAERRMQELVDAQRSFAHLEQHSEVWGPADPDHIYVRKYRRYWMERPTNFPQRHDGVVPVPSRQFAVDQTSAVRGQFETAPEQAPTSVRSNLVALANPVAPRLALPASQKEAEKLAAVFSSISADQTGGPVPVSDRSIPEPVATLPAVPSTLAQQAAPVATHLIGSAPPICAQQSFAATSVFVEKPPPKRIGAGWSQQQWFLKALELSDAFSSGTNGEYNSANLGRDPSNQSPPKVPDHQPCREQTPPPPSRIVCVRNNGAEENLIEAIERTGFNAIDDWYPALDRIYTISDMAKCSAKVEPFVGDICYAGTPGHSYLVSKNRGQKQRDASPHKHEHIGRSEEELLRRYQDRLLFTSLPHRTAGGTKT